MWKPEMQDRHLGPNWSTHLTQQDQTAGRRDGLISAFLAGAPSLTWWCRDKNVWNVTYQGHWEGLTTFIQPRCPVTVLTTHVGLSELGSLGTHKKPVFPVEELSLRDQYWQIPYTGTLFYPERQSTAGPRFAELVVEPYLCGRGLHPMNSLLSISQIHHPDHPARKWTTV